MIIMAKMIGSLHFARADRAHGRQNGTGGAVDDGLVLANPAVSPWYYPWPVEVTCGVLAQVVKQRVPHDSGSGILSSER